MIPPPNRPLAASGVFIGPFVFDENDGCIRDDRREIRLRPKASSVLRVLVANSGAVVHTEDLYRAVWGDTAVTPNTITNVIGELRRALARAPELATCIETIPRRGYRFRGPVRQARAAHTVPRAGIVGRDPELEVLGIAYREAGRGERRAVFISGEAGVGKTTLVDQFTAGLDDAVVAHAHCAPGGEEPYGVFLQALRDLARGPLASVMPILLRQHAPAWLAQLPSLLAEEERERIARSLIGDGPGRLLRESNALFAAVCRKRTVVLVCEDLHWADEPSLRMLDSIAADASPARLLILATYRSVDALVSRHPIVATVATLRRRRDVAAIALEPFSIDGVRLLLECEFSSPVVAEKLAESVALHCGGNPLYVKAVCDQLRGEGWIRSGEAGVEVAADIGRFVPRLPEDLHSLIELQLGELPASSLRFLEAVSVIGDGATAALIAATLEESVADIRDRAYELVRHGVFLRLLPEIGVADGEEGYAFRHTLYQRAVYGRIAPSIRSRAHARVGRFLEARVPHVGAHGEGALRLAQHFEAAGDRERAATWRERAGVLALQRFDHTQALHSLQRALDHLDSVPEAPDAELRRARVYLAIANAATPANGFLHPSVADAFARAEQHAEAAGAMREQIRALLGASSIPLAAGRPMQAQEMVERLLATAVLAPEPMRAYCYTRAARLAIVDGRFQDAAAWLERSDGMRFEPGIPSQIDAEAETDSWRAIALAHRGCLEDSRAAANRAMARAETVGLPWGHAAVLAIVLHVALVLRDHAWASAVHGRLHERCLGHDLPTYAPLARLIEHYLEGIDAPSQRVAEAMETVLRTLRHAGVCGDATFHWVLLAEMRMRLSQVDAAEAALDAAFALSEDGGESHQLAEVWRLRGAIRLATAPRSSRSALAAADECCRRAREIAAAQGSRLFQVRAASGLAAVLLRKNDAAQAESVLIGACRDLPQPAGWDDARAALQLLESLRGDPAPQSVARRRPVSRSRGPA